MISINTGALLCEIHSTGNFLFKNLKINGKTISENGRLICTLEDKSKIDENIVQYNDFQSIIKEVTVEQTGPVRAVVKVTGMFKALKSDREIFPFTVRLYFYAGLQTVRVVHSFVYDGNQDKDFIKGLGIVFDVPFREQIQNRHVRFSGENSGLWSEPVKPIVTRSPFVYNGDRDIPQNREALDFFDAAIKSGKDFDMNKFTNKKWVKNTGILLHSDWAGYIDLSNPVRRRIFENYLNKSK
ncbi:MAG: hypothetical protein Q7U47_13460 [Paludibacter sp.]|nr:hypothetical protein [Paludibacter sp.]